MGHLREGRRVGSRDCGPEVSEPVPEPKSVATDFGCIGIGIDEILPVSWQSVGQEVALVVHPGVGNDFIIDDKLFADSAEEFYAGWSFANGEVSAKNQWAQALAHLEAAFDEDSGPDDGWLGASGDDRRGECEQGSGQF